MFQLDSRLMAVFSIVFVALGAFNLVVGRNRMLQMRASGQARPWYRQIPILTGIEYILLGIVLLLNLGINSGFFPATLTRLITPMYTFVLILAAVVLAAMLFQALQSKRTQPTAQTPITTIETQTKKTEHNDLSAEQKAEAAQRRRDRRQKAASARRRQSGRV